MKLFVLALLMSVGVSFVAQATNPQCIVDPYTGVNSCDMRNILCFPNDPDSCCQLTNKGYWEMCDRGNNSMKAKMNRANAQKAQPHAPANPHPNARMHR